MFVGAPRRWTCCGARWARRGAAAWPCCARRSGIGKTTLIRRFLRGLGESAFVLEGRCFEREAVPFKMLDGVVDSLTGAIVGLPMQVAEQLAPRDIGSLVRLFPVLRRVSKFVELASQGAVPPDPQRCGAAGSPRCAWCSAGWRGCVRW